MTSSQAPNPESEDKSENSSPTSSQSQTNALITPASHILVNNSIHASPPRAYHFEAPVATTATPSCCNPDQRPNELSDQACPSDIDITLSSANNPANATEDETDNKNLNHQATSIFESPIEQASSPNSLCSEFSQTPPVPAIDWFESAPVMIAGASQVYKKPVRGQEDGNYLRGCLWAPDGSCILTNSRDNILRIFNLPTKLFSPIDGEKSSVEEMYPVLSMREHELIYDFAWYPIMNSMEPATCCFASSSRRNPIRLWDAFSGLVRAVYRPIDHLGELASPHSLAFSADGQTLYTGFNRCLHVFDVSRPGEQSTRRPSLGKKPQQGGIISCIAVPSDPNYHIYATGSYNGSVCLFAEPGQRIACLRASPSGVTQIKFTHQFGQSNCGASWYLTAGSRMDSRIFTWDSRNFDRPLSILRRRVENHQRFQFDFDKHVRCLFTGSQTGALSIYDLDRLGEESDREQACPKFVWRAHRNSTHGVSVHPTLPVVASCSGQRRIIRRPGWSIKSDLSSLSDTSDSEVELNDLDACAVSVAKRPSCYGKLMRLPYDNSLTLWHFGQKSVDETGTSCELADA